MERCKNKFSLGTTLKGNRSRTAEKGTLELEAFLFQVDRKLLGEDFYSKIEKVTEKLIK